MEALLQAVERPYCIITHILFLQCGSRQTFLLGPESWADGPCQALLSMCNWLSTFISWLKHHQSPIDYSDQTSNTNGFQTKLDHCYNETFGESFFISIWVEMIKEHIVIVAEARKIGNTAGLHSHSQCWLVSTNRWESQIVMLLASKCGSNHSELILKIQVHVLKMKGS